MSGSVGQIPLEGVPVNPWPITQQANQAGLIGAQAGQAQAQTGLIGQQTQAAAIQNQFQRMRLGAIAPYLGGGGGGIDPAAGGAVGAPSGPPPLSAYGAVASPFGVAVPGLMAVSALTAQDPTKAWGEVLSARARTMGQALGGTTNPQEWNQGVQSLYQSGWLSPQDYVTLYNHVDHRPALLQAIQDPDKYAANVLTAAGQGLQYDQSGNLQVSPTAIAAKGQAALAGHAGEIPSINMPGPGNSVIPQQMIRTPDGGFAPLTAGGQGAPSPALAALPPPMQGVIQRAATAAGVPTGILAGLKVAETGIGPGTTPGDGGASHGIGQDQQPVIDAYNAAHRTNFTGEDFDQNPSLSASASAEYWAKLNQHFKDPAIATIAYNWGPTKTDAWVKAGADPSQLPPKVMDYAQRVLSGGVAATQSAAAPAPGAEPTPRQIAMGQYNPATGAAVGGTIGAGVPQLTPQQQTAYDIDKGRLAEDQKLVTDAQTGAMKAQVSMPVVLDLRQRALANPQAFGSAGDLRTSISNVLQTFAPEAANQFTSWATNQKLDPSSVGDRQAMMKEAFNLVTSAESQIGGARVGAMLTNYFSKAMPNINMQGDAVKEMLNFILIGNQMTRDYAQGAAQHFNQASAAFPGENPTKDRYSPLTQFDQQWTTPGAPNSPQVYEAASNLLNGRTYDALKGLTPAQQAEAYRIVFRADPSARLGAAQVPH